MRISEKLKSFLKKIKDTIYRPDHTVPNGIVLILFENCGCTPFYSEI